MINNTMGMTPNNAGMYQPNMRAPQAPVARRGKTRGTIV
jgi:hypothetical protein